MTLAGMQNLAGTEKWKKHRERAALKSSARTKAGTAVILVDAQREYFMIRSRPESEKPE